MMRVEVIGNATLYLGDCLEVLRTLADNSIDSIVTDPPYGLAFMGKRWDYDVPSQAIWEECLRVLKPGGHLLAFAGTRTQHRMAVRIEDAGFEIRDMIAWVYGSGFPKSLDVSKAIAKRAGGDVAARDAISFMRDRREELGLSRPEFEHLIFGRSDGNVRNWEDGISLPKPGLWADIKRAMGLEVTPFDAAMERGDEVIGSEGGDFGYQKNGARWDEARVIRAPATDAARHWQGWGTALKPALEPITVARKPLIGTVAENVLQFGTGALNVDGCRVGHGGTEDTRRNAAGGDNGLTGTGTFKIRERRAEDQPLHYGRWPANLIHDGSDEVLAGFPTTTIGGGNKSRKRSTEGGNCYGTYQAPPPDVRQMNTGSAARFFYCAKASKRDREEGLEHMEAVHRPNGNKWTDQDYRVARGERQPSAESGPRKNIHPTVKPTDLMRYLCRLVTPPGGIVLDHFMGSGSTGKAAMLEGFRFIGIERERHYFEIACRRIEQAAAQGQLLPADPAGEPQQAGLAL